MQDWLFWAFLLPFFFDKQLLFGLCFSLTLCRTDGCGKCKIRCLYATALTSDDFCAILANLESQFLAGSRCVACTWRTPVAQLFLLHFSLHVSGLYAVAKTDGGVDLVDSRQADCRSVCMGGCRDGYVLMSASLRCHVFFSFVLTNIHSELLAVLEN